ncbi:cyclase family protein [Mucilaginibacter mali]|uniref:Cyclase family protein n=1 Tax=Mucilaginibacter mali TaxID=2740462 RepID=A0A7D4QGX1_9SPHI|nr:cyclase family protein [Mucilaginibacter mali]QKJ31472.1 cyclase family protein [Mucilaginibacter mali]
MAYIRLSHIITQDTPAYGNRDRVFIRDNSSILKGDTANSSCWIFSNNHIGTHIDSARHFSATGQKLQDIPIGEFIYERVTVVDISCSTGVLIGVKEFEKVKPNVDADTELLLIRTGYEVHRGKDKYWNDNPGLNGELANYFRQNFPKLRCVGFDFISLTSWNFRPEGRISHQKFLCPTEGRNTILVIEDMALESINGDVIKVIVAPIFAEDGNGGAVTVIAELKNEL